MKELKIKVQPMTLEVMKLLESRDLVKGFKPSERMKEAAEGEVVVDQVYATDLQYGSHMLIAIGFNKSAVCLSYHSANEDFLLIHDGSFQKPLILIIGLHKRDKFARLIENNELDENDIIAVQLEYNNPSCSFFTMNGLTPHCEWTVPGPDPAAIFYVTEPNALDQVSFDLKEYSIQILF